MKISTLVQIGRSGTACLLGDARYRLPIGSTIAANSVLNCAAHRWTFRSVLPPRQWFPRVARMIGISVAIVIGTNEHHALPRLKTVVNSNDHNKALMRMPGQRKSTLGEFVTFETRKLYPQKTALRISCLSGTRCSALAVDDRNSLSDIVIHRKWEISATFALRIRLVRHCMTTYYTENPQKSAIF